MKSLLVIFVGLLLCAPACNKVTDPKPGDDPRAVSDGTAGPSIVDQDPKPDTVSKSPAPEGELKDGRRHGAWVMFHENGKKAAEGTYEEGLKHGEWTFYYSNGNKTAEGAYQKGSKQGAWIEYDEQGKKISDLTYKDGVQIYK